MINLIVHGIYPNIEEYVAGIIDYLNNNNIKFKFVNSSFNCEPEWNDINIIFSGKRINPDNSRYNILFETQNNSDRHINNPPSDYSKFNKIVQMFKENTSDNSVYFPLCYSKHFRGKEPEQIIEDVDVSYFGSMVDYRPEFCKKFNIPSYVAYGETRDKLIYNTKINLLINRWKDDYRFSPLHAFLSWCKGKIVLVQKCPHYEVYDEYVIEFTEENFLDIYNHWLINNKRKEFGYFIQKDLEKKFNLEARLPKLMREILP